jgi:cytochrome c peroxidase
VRARVLAIAIAAAMSASEASAALSWSPDDLALLRTLWHGALDPAPADPSNRVADNPVAATLGQSLFSDRRLSANGRVSCASCHQPEHGFTDARAVGQGMSSGARRTMPVAVAVYSPWQFWDGRADSLWAQALGPVENPAEHGFTRTQVARAIASRYRDAYERTFSPLPKMDDLQRFPVRASPAGDARARAAWAGMSSADQAAVNEIFANFGKAIAAYERTLKVRPGRFDLYLAGLFGAPGNPEPLAAHEVAGLRLFIGKGQCVTCHNGPLLSNQGFANTGVPPRPGRPADRGRAAGVRKAIDDPFNCQGVYSDARREVCEELEFAVVDSPAQVGAFKAPSLRGVSQRAPYMHAGQLASLAQVVDHYNRAPKAAVGVSELRPLHLSVSERRQIVAFLRTLDEPSAAKPQPPETP